MAEPVTPADIAILLQRELTESEEAAVALYIEMAEGEIEAYLGRPIKPTVFEEHDYFPNAAGIVYLRNTPVISVEALTIDGKVFPADGLTVTSYGLENTFGLYWPTMPYVTDTIANSDYYGATVTISYTAGLDYPAAIRSLVLSGVHGRVLSDAGRAYRAAAGGTGVKSIQAEEFIITWQSEMAMSGTSTLSLYASEADFNSIKRYKRIGVR
jgi:hypothetical protein